MEGASFEENRLVMGIEGILEFVNEWKDSSDVGFNLLCIVRPGFDEAEFGLLTDYLENILFLKERGFGSG